MSKIIVLGGCGAVGSKAVNTLVHDQTFSEVIIGDFDIEKATQMAADLGPGVSARKFDAMDRQSCLDAIFNCDLVLNCVGPFYSTVKTILTAAIESGINYVDICDDPDVTLEILDMDEAAKKADITALIGMGASPGITNLLAKLAADDFLDEAVWNRRFIRSIEIIKGAAHGAISPTPDYARRAIGETYKEFIANLYMPEIFLRKRNDHEAKLYKNDLNRVPGTGEIEEFREFIYSKIEKPDDTFREFHKYVSTNTMADIRKGLDETQDSDVKRWLDYYQRKD